MTPKLKTLLLLVVTVWPLDQLTKYLVSTNVQPWEPIPVITGFFRITHSRNPGAALGLAQDVHVGVFIVLTIVAVIFGLLLRRERPR